MVDSLWVRHSSNEGIAATAGVLSGESGDSIYWLKRFDKGDS